MWASPEKENAKRRLVIEELKIENKD